MTTTRGSSNIQPYASTKTEVYRRRVADQDAVAPELVVYGTALEYPQGQAEPVEVSWHKPRCDELRVTSRQALVHGQAIPPPDLPGPRESTQLHPDLTP